MQLHLLLVLVGCYARPLLAVPPGVIQFYVEPQQKVVPTYVTQLVEGKITKLEKAFRMIGSVSLVFDSGYYILVDSPSATDVESKGIMLRGLTSRNLAPGNVQLVVTTHGHPDHFGQGNFFPNARHFFGIFEYADDTYVPTELASVRIALYAYCLQNETMRITPNVELWNTPGHTNQDVSVIVRNVPCCGTVAVVGDLFYNELDAINGTDWFEDAWNPLVGKVNRNKVLCASDYMIPGHGRLFKVTEEMRINAECEALSASTASYVDLTALNSQSPNLETNSINDVISRDVRVPQNTTSSSSTTSATTTISTASAASTTTAHPTLVSSTESIAVLSTFLPGKNVGVVENADAVFPRASIVPVTPQPTVTTALTQNKSTISTASEPTPPSLALRGPNVLQTAGSSYLLPNQAGLVMPVLEAAAVQLAKALNIKVVGVNTPYPYSEFWRKAFDKLALYFKNPGNPVARRDARKALISYINSTRKRN